MIDWAEKTIESGSKLHLLNRVTIPLTKEGAVRYKKILVALDRSPQSEIVFEQALELANREETALMLFQKVNSETT